MAGVLEGVTAPRGFKAAGMSCGIKRSGRPDLSLILSEAPASAAGVFTTNSVKAAPVVLGGRLLAGDAANVRGILTISGVANAMTGSEGISDNESVLSEAERLLGLPPRSLLPACTGVIGPRIPVDRVLRALPALGTSLSSAPAAGAQAANAILTTDTVAKQSSVRVRLSDGTRVRVGGMAKGSGMIAPRLAALHATTLAYVTTDARATPQGLARILGAASEETFNMLCVDGDTSTNDTIYALANGAAGGADASDDPKLAEAFTTVLRSLARQVARDGEGATKLLTVNVSGARAEPDARAAARAVVASTLVKAALFGADPNVGRIACALGYSGAKIDPDRVDVSLGRPHGGVPLIVAGRPAPGLQNGTGRKVRELLRQLDEVRLDIDLHDGVARATAWGCDLSYAYVQINAAYRT
ncbi:MAG: bifunctional glutamate N-acetyltransferase/amino-acid acetyltransferase ArgJ [Thermoplasmata archaeon]|nr:bifunctional glutamate N-acetyltransferase/amino-acid acetyltransferase ArgJ [Thermoplasmata archaeon]